MKHPLKTLDQSKEELLEAYKYCIKTLNYEDAEEVKKIYNEYLFAIRILKFIQTNITKRKTLRENIKEVYID